MTSSDHQHAAFAEQLNASLRGRYENARSKLPGGGVRAATRRKSCSRDAILSQSVARTNAQCDPHAVRSRRKHSQAACDGSSADGLSFTRSTGHSCGTGAANVYGCNARSSYQLHKYECNQRLYGPKHPSLDLGMFPTFLLLPYFCQSSQEGALFFTLRRKFRDFY